MDAPFQIQQVVNVLKKILRTKLNTIYLHGSSVSGGLRPNSDIDLLVIIKSPLTKEEKNLLNTDLLSISGHYPYDKFGRKPLEIVMFVSHLLHNLQYPARCEFIYREWLRDTLEQGLSDNSSEDPEYTLMLAQAQKEVKLLWGEYVILPKINNQQIRKALLDSLPNIISSIEGDERNVLLTLARMWFTMSTGQFISKDTAADWAINRMPNKFIEVMTVARDAYLYGNNVEWTKYKELLPLIIEYFSIQIKNVYLIKNDLVTD